MALTLFLPVPIPFQPASHSNMDFGRALAVSGPLATRDLPSLKQKLQDLEQEVTASKKKVEDARDAVGVLQAKIEVQMVHIHRLRNFMSNRKLSTVSTDPFSLALEEECILREYQYAITYAREHIAALLELRTAVNERRQPAAHTTNMCRPGDEDLPPYLTLTGRALSRGRGPETTDGHPEQMNDGQHGRGESTFVSSSESAESRHLLSNLNAVEEREMRLQMEVEKKRRYEDEVELFDMTARLNIEICTSTGSSGTSSRMT
ncbi:uncharacterized protein EV422DRAFT_514463, partial [Fimicolochytrium jonesii]|uniref:uncharacterized protein n=1 Tax=Fimicolochytrium jonesii TaxID=1396493 RepID=UPI0022FF20D7